MNKHLTGSRFSSGVRLEETSPEFLAAMIGHELLHVAKLDNLRLEAHNNSGHGFSNCESPIRYDRVYFLQTVCFPESSELIDSYLKCPDSCSQTLVAPSRLANSTWRSPPSPERVCATILPRLRKQKNALDQIAKSTEELADSLKKLVFSVDTLEDVGTGHRWRYESQQGDVHRLTAPGLERKRTILKALDSGEFCKVDGKVDTACAELSRDPKTRAKISSLRSGLDALKQSLFESR